MTPRTQVIILAAVLALAGAVDFVQRIHVPRSVATREARIGATELPERPLSLASARERLQSWFPAKAPEPEVTPTDVQDAAGESGATIPDRADLGGWRFILRGVFDAGPPFAVFDIVSSAGGAIEQHRLSAGDTIKGVRVQQISGRKVSLKDGDNVVELALFIDPEDDRVSAKEKDE
ncbi:MAG: hypothetical protein OER87_08560 [Gammaproteobacteria bacterium]|nr:hypothetical protein [Gammaproteobacteria bacterium]